MTYRAFIFDMDGVLVNSEPLWHPVKQRIFSVLVGKEKADVVVPQLVGRSISQVYDTAVSLGAVISQQEFFNLFNTEALSHIYLHAPLTEGVRELITYLKEYSFLIGLVSASAPQWIDIVIDRLGVRSDFSSILSLYDHRTFAQKPAPDGYRETMRLFNTTPNSTIVLEDSNTGIQSGKAAGAYTIGFSGNISSDYLQHGADAYANSMKEVQGMVQQLLV